ncbi:RraA family protein [Azospirillum soli]|uniref:RraA family protein n=1 Tax=Azospirillum soli TaxID=1304799 RepID=UPI001AE5143E|nr:RraA family protein [Azospirillum soli]MBP2311315.1 regulator of RNase E activity RraA [Azospirillum soli]
MAIQRYIVDYPRLTSDILEKWRVVPSGVASDAMNRRQRMSVSIMPMVPGLRLCGQARTVMPMPGDNSMIHHAVSLAESGDVVVVAGGGRNDVALAGEWVVRCCKRRALGGLVVDGAIRDLHEIRSLGVPVFAKGAVPRGPHKNVGGRMDVTASVGDVPVNPGDIILGDEDGVVVVPLGIAEETLEASLKRLERGCQWTQRIEAGKPLVEVRGVRELEIVAPERKLERA